jgi:hypothetical protein
MVQATPSSGGYISGGTSSVSDGLVLTNPKKPKYKTIATPKQTKKVLS